MSQLSDRTNNIHLNELEANFLDGDNNALILAIRHCGNEKLVMPEWVVDGFFKATNDFYKLKVKSLGEAFGMYWPKGKQFPAARKAREIGFSVYSRVRELSQSMPIDEGLFEVVGEEFNIGKTKASEYYYSKKAWMKRASDPKNTDIPAAVIDLLAPYKKD
jgi:hypothetical protein